MRLLLRRYSKDWIHQRHGTKLFGPSNWLRSYCYCSLPIVESDWKGTLAVHPLSCCEPINYSLVHFKFWFLVWFSIELIWAFLSNLSHRFLQWVFFLRVIKMDLNVITELLIGGGRGVVPVYQYTVALLVLDVEEWKWVKTKQFEENPRTDISFCPSW